MAKDTNMPYKFDSLAAAQQAAQDLELGWETEIEGHTEGHFTVRTHNSNGDCGCINRLKQHHIYLKCSPQ